LQWSFGLKYSVIQKELYNDIPHVSVWRVLRKHLHLNAYKSSIAQSVEGVQDLIIELMFYEEFKL
jgi:hypothetical protein